MRACTCALDITLVRTVMSNAARSRIWTISGKAVSVTELIRQPRRPVGERRHRREARASPEGFAVCVALVLVFYLFALVVSGWLG